MNQDPRETPAAEAESITKIYGQKDTEVRALDDVSIRFKKGTFTAVMGPSGSGKSTLLHAMAGLDRVTSGVARIGGIDITNLSDRELTVLRRHRIGFVFQAFNLVPTLTAGENIDLPFALAGKRPDDAWRNEVIQRLGLTDRLKHRPAQLSGGQQQRVAGARALVAKPDIIFADEPTGNLDSASGAELLRFLREAVDKWDQTIVMVTHDAQAAAIADRVVFLRDGKVSDTIDQPTADQILDRLKQLAATPA